MPDLRVITPLLQAALARLDPRDILNFPECAAEDFVDRSSARQPPEHPHEPRGKDAD